MNPETENPNDTIANTSSFLPFHSRQYTEESAIRSTLNNLDPLDWPEIQQTLPINEFKVQSLATLVFPALFPYGKGDPTNPARQRTVTLTEGFKHLIRFGEKTAHGNYTWRFANHPRFPFWALNMKHRHQLLSQTTIYLHHHPEDDNLTVDELRAMAQTSTAQQLMTRLQRYTAKVQGSNQYWFQRYLELRSLLEQKGPPTIFWTLSSADMYWPDLHALLPHLDDNPHHGMRVQAVIENPHLTDWYFTCRLSDWVQEWLYNTLDADWCWYRFEYQARGSTHAHGCAKLKNDPGITELVQKAASAWMISQGINLTSVDDSTIPIIMQEGEQASNTVLAYADWLVTTWNDNVPDNFWRQPFPHPSALSLYNVTDIEADYHDLVNSVERHT